MAARTIDWAGVRESLDEYGHGDLGVLIDKRTRAGLIAGFDAPERYRRQIDMARHGFGRGTYKYFDYPLPDVVARLRQRLYPGLAEIANAWQATLANAHRFPETLDGMLAACHADGQTRPTPLILRYGPGDYNCLHQDLYGPHVFPLQVVVLLSEADAFSGGQFVVTEQRPRMQSRVEVVDLEPGRGVVFAVNERPKMGKRGAYRVKQRHGVSRIVTGSRFTLGLIFHDAA